MMSLEILPIMIRQVNQNITFQNHIQKILGQHSAGNLLFYSSERVYRYSQETAFHSFIDAQNDTEKIRLCPKE